MCWTRRASISISSFKRPLRLPPKRRLVTSIHMRWSTTPSLRTRATLARFMPRRFTASSAQRFGLEKRVAHVSMIRTASNSAVRTIESRTLLTPSVPAVPARLIFLGGQPKVGVDRNRFLSARAIISISRWSLENSPKKVARAASIAPITVSKTVFKLPCWWWIRSSQRRYPAPRAWLHEGNRRGNPGSRGHLSPS